MLKVKKSTSFWIICFILCLLYLITLFSNETIALQVCPIIILAIASSGLGFQGTNVLDNYQKSKYYRAELDKG